MNFPIEKGWNQGKSKQRFIQIIIILPKNN